MSLRCAALAGPALCNWRGVVIKRGQNGLVCVGVRQCVCGTSINESTPPTRLVWTNTGLYGALPLSLSTEFVKLTTYK